MSCIKGLDLPALIKQKQKSTVAKEFFKKKLAMKESQEASENMNLFFNQISMRLDPTMESTRNW